MTGPGPPTVTVGGIVIASMCTGGVAVTAMGGMLTGMLTSKTAGISATVMPRLALNCPRLSPRQNMPLLKFPPLKRRC